MKYQSSITKVIHELTFDESSSKKRYKCPECGFNSKRTNPTDLQYYAENKRAYCHKCTATFFEYKPFIKKKEYVIPEWRNKTNLTDKAVKFFESRMISQNTLIKMQIFSDVEFMPQVNEKVEVICFPYIQDKSQKNIKFRGQNKIFKLISGAELIWYNFDSLIKILQILQDQLPVQ